MQANPWEMDWTQPQPTTGGPAMTPITGADPKRAVEQDRAELGLRIDQLQLQGQDLTNQLKKRELEEARLKAEKEAGQKRDLEQVRDELANVIDAARRAKDMSRNGWFTTGIGSGVNHWLGTPAAKNLQGQLDVIGSNVAFDRLQKMRAESPTGGALGSITERELQLLQSTVASLDPGQDDEQFQRNMDTIIQRYSDMLGKLGGEAAAEAPKDRPSMFNDRTEAQPLEFEVSDDRRPGETDEQYRERIERGDVESPPVEPTPNPRAGTPGFVQSMDAAIRGVADTFTFGAADRIAAGAETLFGGGGTLDENLGRERAIDKYDAENHFGARFTGQLGGGLLNVSRLLPSVLRSAAPSTASGLAALGAAGGGVYGYNSSDKGWTSTDALVDAGLGAVTGAAVSGTLGLIGNHIPSRGNSPAINLYEAAQRQGVNPLPADVGGVATQKLTAGVAQSPFGSGAIIRGAERANDQAGAKLLQIAQAEGNPVRQEVLGEVAQRGAKRYIAGSRAEGQALYGAARAEAGDATTAAERAVAKIDEHLAELSPASNTNAEAISALNKLKADLVDSTGNLKAMPIDAIRQIRTGVRGMAQQEGLRGTDFERRANQVLSELREDISASLSPEARAAFREADRKWQIRLQTIDDVMEEVIGPKGERSAEKVAARLINMGRTDSSRLRRFVESLPQEEAGIVRGSLIQEIGRAASGQQGAAGNKFSLSAFLTNWDTLPERTRNMLFRGESRAAIEDLAKIADGAKITSRHANTSNTAGATNVSELGRAVSYGVGWTTLGTSIVLENLTGRLLASPALTRVLIWAARQRRDPAEIARRLNRVAVRDPAIASEVRSLVSGGEDKHQEPSE